MLSSETTELTSQFPIPPPVKVKALENAKSIEVTDEVSQPDTFSSNFALLSNKYDRSVMREISHASTGPYGELVQSTAAMAASSSFRVTKYAKVGEAVGTGVGNLVGAPVGVLVGTLEGDFVGLLVGEFVVGGLVGPLVGAVVKGELVGTFVGVFVVGGLVGPLVGAVVGEFSEVTLGLPEEELSDGTVLGSWDGSIEGAMNGIVVGPTVGAVLGAWDGSNDCAMDGIILAGAIVGHVLGN